nr:MAG TPA: hypothetical protein [Caudoviricetes sp.]
MNNVEKFWDDFLKERLCEEGGFGVCKNKNVPMACVELQCNCCIFGRGAEECRVGRSRWLDSEFKEYVNWETVLRDTKVFFKDLENDTWEKGYFAEYDKYEDTIFIFADGRTSYTAKNSIAYDPKYVKLYKEEDE